MVQGQGIRAIEQSGFLLYESSVHREVRARTRIRMIAGQEPNTQLYFHSSYLFLSLSLFLSSSAIIDCLIESEKAECAE